MARKPSLFALLAASAALSLAAGPAGAAPPPKKPLTAKEKAAAEKAAKEAAEKEAAEKAAREKADKEAAEKAVKEAEEKAAAEKAAKEAEEKAAADKAAKEKAEEEAKVDPFEEPSKTYRFIGLRFRDAVIPKFMLNLFANGGRTVNVPMVGPEFTQRHDRFQFDVAVMYGDFTMDATLFKGKSQPDTSYEMVASGLRQLMISIDLLYEIPLEKKDDKVGRFSLLIGGGVGLGFVMGPLYRSQVYPKKAGANGDDPTGWSLCRGTGKPDPLYCENPNGHFSPTENARDGYAEPSWAGGGSKPILFPWLSLPQVSFRYKPIKQLQTKVDTGFSTAGFFFGLSASYGL